MINKAKRFIKGKLCYDIILNKDYTPDEKRKKMAKYDKMLKDDTILIEFMKIAVKCLNQAIIELEERIKNETNSN